MIQILQGDCREVLKTLPDESVQCCVTSPPYWGLRDYGVDGQLGLEKTPQEYVATMLEVFREVRRVLKSDGVCWINLGDSYASSPTGSDDQSSSTLRGGKDTQIEGGKRPSKIVGGLKPKDLVGIPWMVAFALRADGWYLRSDIIWSKPNPMPESVTDRPTKAHEYIFLLTKSQKYFYDADAIAEPASYAMYAQMEQGYDGDSTKEYEANGVQNPSDVKRRIIENAKRKSVARGDFNGKTNELEGREAFRAFTITRNKRTVWTVPTHPYKEAHFATFPPALILPCILAGSKTGDTVLDPFLGSGTTAMVALENARKCIGIELNPNYLPMIEKRTQVVGFPL